MLQKFSENSFLMGAASAIIAVICFSINDVAIKFLSGNYALHQVVLFRSIIGLFFLLFFILPFSGGWKALSTKRLGIIFCEVAVLCLQICHSSSVSQLSR